MVIMTADVDDDDDDDDDDVRLLHRLLVLIVRA